ncbi:MAG: hypothetical protein FD177_1020 [Desulfovibrionaceae bacterium]|nr:MAG: hypothetical protein FD177_1020 [Desulfovibrionaceae bacterium]
MIDLNSSSAVALSGRINWHIDTAIDADAARQPRRNYLGASVIADPCERAVQYYALGAEQDRPALGTKQDIFARGHWIEEQMIKRMRGAGFILLDRDPRTGEQFEAEWFDGKVKGHPDGMLLHWMGREECPIPLPALWECKGLGSKWWKKVVKEGLRACFPRYYGQMQLLMGGFKLNRGLFTAVNADTMERYHQVIEFSPSACEALLARAGRIFLANDAGELLPRPYFNSAGMECSMCNYKATCWPKQ